MKKIGGAFVISVVSWVIGDKISYPWRDTRSRFKASNRAKGRGYRQQFSELFFVSDHS